MARYGRTAQREVRTAMREYKRGRPQSRTGKPIKSRRQAIAIGLSKARRRGAKVPPKKRS